MIVKISNGTEFQVSFHHGQRLVSWGEPGKEESRMTEFTEAVAKFQGEVVIATVSRYHEDVPNREKARKYAFKKLMNMLKEICDINRFDTAKFWEAFATLTPTPKFHVVCKSAAQKLRDKELKAERKAMRESLKNGLLQTV